MNPETRGMPNCDDIGPLLARRGDGTLDDERKALVDAHLEQCGACRQSAAGQLAVADLLRAREPESVPPDFVARVRARIDEAPGWLDLADWRSWTWRLAPIAAALALVAFLTSSSQATSPATTSVTTTWSDADAISALTQSSMTGDALLDSVLTGRVNTVQEGSSNGR